MQGQALPGFRDFYPDELALRNHIFGTWREVARRYGFQEYDGPPLEPLELYTDKSGEEIVQQLYAFDDKGGRKVALRPEMTPTLAPTMRARVGVHPGAQEADPLVLDPAAVPLRAAATGTAAGALSAQHGHPRRSEPARRRGADRGRDRHHARLRAGAARRAGPDVRSPRAAHLAARARPERGAARRGVRGDRQERAGSTRSDRGDPFESRNRETGNGRRVRNRGAAWARRGALGTRQGEGWRGGE